jgi:hypothetical protein
MLIKIYILVKRYTTAYFYGVRNNKNVAMCHTTYRLGGRSYTLV